MMLRGGAEWLFWSLFSFLIQSARPPWALQLFILGLACFALRAFAVSLSIWIHRLGQTAGWRMAGVPILRFYAPGLAWSAGTPKGNQLRVAWTGVVEEGEALPRVTEDTPQVRRGLANGIFAGVAAVVISGIAFAVAGALLWQVWTSVFVQPILLMLILGGLVMAALGLENLILKETLNGIETDAETARRLLRGEISDRLLIARAATASAEGRLPELAEELDAAAAAAQDPKSRINLAIWASLAKASPEREKACWDALDAQLAGHTKAVLAAELHFMFWRPGVSLPALEELGLSAKEEKHQILILASYRLLRAHAQGADGVREEVKTLGKWSQSAAVILGWRWLSYNERRWRAIDPALGDAFRAGAQIPDDESANRQP
jgi:hypothetical protein